MEPVTIEESIDRLSEDYFTSKLAAVKVLYLELDCLQDFNIGAILYLISTEKEYVYMQKQLPVYNARRDTAVMKHFPDLKFTDTDIQAVLHDEDKHSVLVRLSPMTSYYKYFTRYIYAVEHNNNTVLHKTPPQLFIGCPTVKYTEEEKHQFINEFSKHTPNWTITITDTDITDYDDLILESIDHFTVFNTDTLFTNERFGALMEDNKMLLFKAIHAFPIITEHTPEVSDDQLLENTEVTFSTFSDFKYVSMEV